MRETFLAFGQPDIREPEIAAVERVMRSGWIGTGPKVQEFEAAFKAYKDTPYASAVSSCSAGLHLAMLSLGIGPGDEVITTAMTFCATVNAIVHTGATPVLADIEHDSWNISPACLEAKITKKTKAILVVHFAGRPCEMDRIMELANRHKLYVIEDCAHAIEAHYKGQKCGTIGDVGIFSFYVTKNITTGEGGMVISKHRDVIDKVKCLRLQGMSGDAWNRFGSTGYQHYEVKECGFKYNMTDLQAVMGIHQLARIEECSEVRAHIWNKYLRAFQGLPFDVPMSADPSSRHAMHLFQIYLGVRPKRRELVLEELTRANIGVGVHYISIPEHPFYAQHFKWDMFAYPNAHQFGRHTISLPLSSKLTERDTDDVVEAVKNVFK